MAALSSVSSTTTGFTPSTTSAFCANPASYVVNFGLETEGQCPASLDDVTDPKNAPNLVLTVSERGLNQNDDRGVSLSSFIEALEEGPLYIPPDNETKLEQITSHCKDCESAKRHDTQSSLDVSNPISRFLTKLGNWTRLVDDDENGAEDCVSSRIQSKVWRVVTTPSRLGARLVLRTMYKTGLCDICDSEAEQLLEEQYRTPSNFVESWKQTVRILQKEIFGLSAPTDFEPAGEEENEDKASTAQRGG